MRSFEVRKLASSLLAFGAQPDDGSRFSERLFVQSEGLPGLPHTVVGRYRNRTEHVVVVHSFLDGNDVLAAFGSGGNGAQFYRIDGWAFAECMIQCGYEIVV